MAGQNTILVTGGASGIGLAIVRALVQRGWRAIVADLDQGNLDRARDDLARHRELVHFEQLNVTDEEAVISTIARCDRELGPLTGLVNSAGIGHDVPCLDTTATLFRRI